MPAFGIGVNSNNIDSGRVQGKSYNIACKVWFTSTGQPTPLSFKFEGDDGMIITVDKLHVKHTEDKVYYGEKSLEYRCDIIVGGLKKDVKLIFYTLSCKWIMVV